MNSIPHSVELYTAARRKSEDRYFQLWALARYQDTSKRGWVSHRDLFALYQELTHKSLQNFKVLLKNGIKWWTVTRHRIYYTGLTALSQRFQIKAQTTIFLQSAHYASLQTFRGACLGGLYTGVPQARATFARKLGVTKQTIRNYTQKTQTAVVKNAVVQDDGRLRQIPNTYTVGRDVEIYVKCGLLQSGRTFYIDNVPPRAKGIRVTSTLGRVWDRVGNVYVRRDLEILRA